MTSAIWKLAALKIVCCGGPLLILLVASGAVAVVDVALGAAVLGLVVGGWLLWRRRRACACELPALEQREQFADVTPGQHERAPRDRVLAGAGGERARKDHVTCQTSIGS